MNWTAGTIKRIMTLREGETVPSSALKGDWVDELLELHILGCQVNGSRRKYVVRDREGFDAYLVQLDSRLSDLEGLLAILADKQPDRAQMAAVGGNSKTRLVAASTGFLMKCFSPIGCSLGDEPYELNLPPGLAWFVEDSKGLRIPADVLVVGLENMESFQRLGEYKEWFEPWLSADERRILFVIGFPGRKALVNWLKTIPNRYLHFGDFDLSGIQIFEGNFRKVLGDRATFLIPDDVEERIRMGSQERYDKQWTQTRHLRSDLPELQRLIELIHRYKKGYDQEGYILRH